MAKICAPFVIRANRMAYIADAPVPLIPSSAAAFYGSCGDSHIEDFERIKCCVRSLQVCKDVEEMVKVVQPIRRVSLLADVRRRKTTWMHTYLPAG